MAKSNNLLYKYTFKIKCYCKHLVPTDKTTPLSFRDALVFLTDFTTQSKEKVTSGANLEKGNVLKHEISESHLVHNLTLCVYSEIPLYDKGLIGKVGVCLEEYYKSRISIFDYNKELDILNANKAIVVEILNALHYGSDFTMRYSMSCYQSFEANRVKVVPNSKLTHYHDISVKYQRDGNDITFIIDVAADTREITIRSDGKHIDYYFEKDLEDTRSINQLNRLTANIDGQYPFMDSEKFESKLDPIYLVGCFEKPLTIHELQTLVKNKLSSALPNLLEQADEKITKIKSRISQFDYLETLAKIVEYRKIFKEIDLWENE